MDPYTAQSSEHEITLCMEDLRAEWTGGPYTLSTDTNYQYGSTCYRLANALRYWTKANTDTVANSVARLEM